LAWHFCTEKNSKKIEKVQERAFRFVYEDYNSSYDNLLKKAKVPSLQIRRMRTMALETFVGAANLKEFLPYRAYCI
jgi:hypothetical protein